MLKQVGGRTADQMKNPEGMVLDGVQSFPICFQFPKVGKRFADNLGDNAKIENIGPPEKVISAFGPEVIVENVDGKVLSTEVMEHEGKTYYHFELEPPHVLITATAAGLQWKRHSKELKRISETFRVV
ncbi:Psbp family [Thalictrum thalictroides]|uniref:Psbp family n=1 Tax=Thalictrum thalictroides TaxID=46969 RepID=A0A7J6WCU2_THATH|nr:Psbp family [Thalictrum thalictroides]